MPVFEGYSNKAGDWERTLSLREICIVRALYRLGDTPDGLGRRTLEAWQIPVAHSPSMRGWSLAAEALNDAEPCGGQVASLTAKSLGGARGIDFGRGVGYNVAHENHTSCWNGGVHGRSGGGFNRGTLRRRAPEGTHRRAP